jgi:hypothetical protein
VSRDEDDLVPPKMEDARATRRVKTSRAETGPLVLSGASSRSV